MPGITTAFAEGVAASRPAASSSNAGYMWYSTDTQILSQSNGSSWTQIAAGVALDLLSAKGDLLTRTSSAYSRLGVGSNDQVLTADSAAGTGLKWATPASGFSDPTTTKGDLIVHGASTTRLGVGSNDQVLTADSTQSSGLKWAGAASLSVVSAALGADVTISTAGTWYDGPSVSCAAGTWLLIGALSFRNGSSADLFAKLWDGTTASASGGVGRANGGNSQTETVTLAAVVTPGSTTTYKLSGTADTSGSEILKAAIAQYGAGNNASFLVGVKVA